METTPLYIGITATETAYGNYPLWVKGDERSLKIVCLTPDNHTELAKCSGVVLSGGIDVFPGTYHSTRLDYPLAPRQHDEGRDAFETAIFRQAMERKLPVLAICRGMQLANVLLGGTLIQDLEETGKANHRKQEGKDQLHPIRIEPDSLLSSLALSAHPTVNSAHHQGIDRVGAGLVITAWSEEGVPEAIEWADPSGKPFFLGVQWHPERLEQALPGDVFTQHIRSAFLEAARTFTP